MAPQRVPKPLYQCPQGYRDLLGELLTLLGEKSEPREGEVSLHLCPDKAKQTEMQTPGRCPQGGTVASGVPRGHPCSPENCGRKHKLATPGDQAPPSKTVPETEVVKLAGQERGTVPVACFSQWCSLTARAAGDTDLFAGAQILESLRLKPGTFSSEAGDLSSAWTAFWHSVSRGQEEKGCGRGWGGGGETLLAQTSKTIKPRVRFLLGTCSRTFLRRKRVVFIKSINIHAAW